MKRRKFLGMFGAAIAAPMAPLPTMASSSAVYSRSALHAAIIHARTRVSFSVWGLATTLGVPVAQAEALMIDLAKRGTLGPIQGTTYGGRWATSNIMHHKTAIAAQQAARRTVSPKSEPTTQSAKSEPDLSLLISHLRNICLDHGMTLHPRCAA